MTFEERVEKAMCELNSTEELGCYSTATVAREPTDEMEGVGKHAMDTDDLDPTREEVRRGFNAMRDAYLKSG